jgi:methyl-accepting chemotaxis protein
MATATITSKIPGLAPARSRFSFKDMKLAGKFGLISAILVLGFAALGAAYWQVNVVNVRATDDTAHITRFGELVDAINIQFLEMRRVEKDFIIDQDAALLDTHRGALAGVEANIATILQDPPTEEVTSLLEDMSLYLGLYQGSFGEMVKSMEAAGLDEKSGFLGQLNSSANNINDLVESEGDTNLQNSLLKIRQYERAYIENPTDELAELAIAEKDVFASMLGSSEMDEDTQLFISSDLETYVQSLLSYGDALVKLRTERETFSDVAQEFAPILASMKQTKDTLQDATRLDAERSQSRISMIFVGIIVLVAGVVNIAFFKLSRMVATPLQQAVSISAAIASGRLENKVTVTSRDETGELLKGLADMQAQLRQQKVQLNEQMDEARRQASESARMAEEQQQMAVEQARIATENGRIKQALDGVSSAVILFDANLEIIYHNDAALALFRQGENDIRRVLPNFSANGLLGKGVDYLYLNAAHESLVFRNLTQPQVADKELGGRKYRITIGPVNDAKGKRIGTVAEWTDRTTEVAVEEEVKAIVTAAMSGDLSQRIELNNKNGFFYELSSGVNQLVNVSEKVIKETVSVLGCLARGDLTHTMNGDFQGIFSQLKYDVNTTVGKLTEVVRNIQNSAGALDEVATEITDSNAEVSMRTEQQAASLEETAATIEEMTATVKQTADNTLEADRLANAARVEAEAGGNIVGQAIAAMSDINTSSKKITNIIGVIDKISFQTNLLALNASVEAARAGEQGRSFAVVADEVRKLAVHSAGAAKEIRELIDHSNRQVERGTDLVNKSGDALNSIVSSIKQVTSIISEISAASQEQSEGINQVNSSISNIDAGTQQNAVMVEKVTRSIDTMSDQAQRLNEMMKFFSIERSGGGKTTSNINRLKLA